MADEPHKPAPADAADPSMEEILASIRRILNDDDAPAAAPAEPAGEAETLAAPDDDVLVLDQSMVVAVPEPAPEAVTVAPIAVPEAAPPEPAMEAKTSSSQPSTWQQPAPTPELLAPEAAAAATSAVGSLVRTLAAGRATQVYSGGPTLEDMVRAELRPLLKEWLDTNLPPMVERLVRLEIERVVGHAVP